MANKIVNIKLDITESGEAGVSCCYISLEVSVEDTGNNIASRMLVALMDQLRVSREENERHYNNIREQIVRDELENMMKHSRKQ